MISHGSRGWKFEAGMTAWWGKGPRRWQTVTSRGGRSWGALWGLMPQMRWSKHLPKAPPSKTIPLGIRISTCKFGETQTFRPQHYTVHVTCTFSVVFSIFTVRSLAPLTLDHFNCLKWSEVAQSCPTLCNPMDCSPPASSVHGILQARILEWVAISFSRGSSRPRDRTQVSRIAGRHFNLWATRELNCLITLKETPYPLAVTLHLHQLPTPLQP